MKTIKRWYWTARLLGYRVDPAKNIIYNHKKWHFIVLDGTYDPSGLEPKNNRLRLHTSPQGRIVKVDIG